METKRFKTNAACSGCVAHIGLKLNKIVPPEHWSIDLDSPDKVLTVVSDFPEEKIVATVAEAGYKAAPLR